MQTCSFVLILVFGYITNGDGALDPRCPILEDESSIVTILPHESDCAKFYVCSHGRIMEQQCGKDLLFNPELSVSNGI